MSCFVGGVVCADFQGVCGNNELAGYSAFGSELYFKESGRLKVFTECGGERYLYYLYVVDGFIVWIIGVTNPRDHTGL